MIKDGGDSIDKNLIKDFCNHVGILYDIDILSCLQSYIANVHGKSSTNFLIFWSTNICCLWLEAGST